jgi:long-chain acyl-CoA synthetase
MRVMKSTSLPPLGVGTPHAAVFGIPHSKWGETPVAAVVLSAGAPLTQQELLDWVNKRVGAKFQRLNDIVVLDDFPRNVAGKTLKRDLRDAYLARQECHQGEG